MKYLLFLTCLYAVNASASQLKWFRGNTHVHTTMCDHADTSPEEVTKWYHDEGYNFLVLSEHNRFIDPDTVKMPTPKRDDFILIPGEEVTGNKTIHTTALNVRGLVPWDADSELKSEILQRHVDEIRKQGGEAISNHPNYIYALSLDDILPVKNLKLFELYNGSHGVNNEGDQEHISTERLWDLLLTHGKRMYGVSSDDAHQFKKMGKDSSNPGRGWVMVRAASLDPDTITKAMADGDFYASSGVTLKDVQIGKGSYKISVDAEATKKEVARPFVIGKKLHEGETGFTIEFIGADGEVLAAQKGTSAEFDLSVPYLYVRAKVTYVKKSATGVWSYSAWTQPVFYSP